jgi:hypothetical protein
MPNDHQDGATASGHRRPPDTPPPGTTSTGMADAFASFWYFGFLKFLLIAYLLGRLYGAAVKGNTLSQIVYMLSVVPAILVMTHFTNEIVIAWIHMAMFLGPALYYARIPYRGAPQTILPSLRHG